MTRILGYARDLRVAGDGREAQVALKRAGAERVYRDDLVSGVRHRPQLDACLRALHDGDVLVVATALALSHSVDHFVATVSALHNRNVAFRSLNEQALSNLASDGTNSSDVIAALDMLRRDLLSLRTRQGLDAALDKGRRPGRPRVMTEERLSIARELRSHERSFASIARSLGVSEAAVRRALAPTESAH